MTRFSRRSALRDAEIEDRLFWSAGVARLDFPRRTRAFGSRVGFIGSDILAHMLEPECDLVRLSPENWRLALGQRLVDLVLVEPARPDENGIWGAAFSDAADGNSQSPILYDQALRAGIPVTYWLTSDAAYRDFHLGFAAAADFVFCADLKMVDILRDMGHAAVHLPVGVQPSIHNPFVEFSDVAAATPSILFDGWAALVDRPALVPELQLMSSMGLGVVESRALLKTARREPLSHLAPAVLGHVRWRDYLFLLKRAKILVQVAGTHTRQMAERQALEAAACRTCVLHFGELPEGDQRRNFAECFSSWGDLRMRAAQLLSDPIEWLREAQLSWRYVHSQLSVRDALGKILIAAGLISSLPAPGRATVVAPTIRPALLERVLAQFRAQTWPEKELIVVANTDNRDEWDTSLIAADRNEQIVFLPRDYWASAALNIGAQRASGQYVFRMDDDDLYGENYVADAMLHATAVDPDVMGKEGAFVFSEAHNALHRRVRKSALPTVFPSSKFDYSKASLAGFTHAIRVATLRKRGYPEMAFGTADASFLGREKEIGELTLAVLDPLNAVFERRVDQSTHTWRQELRWDSPQFKQLSHDTSAVMV